MDNCFSKDYAEAHDEFSDAARAAARSGELSATVPLVYPP
jgi:hypothetical protein